MSHSVLDSISHILATGFLIYRVTNTSIDQVATEPLIAIAAEQRRHVCGSVDAALANLDDTWREAKRSERNLLHMGYLNVLDQMIQWREDGVLPDSESCSKAVEIFRLNFVDAPKRKVNWSYRITRSEEL